ncbi:MAG TPA: 16S rRNA (guanine(966)-N(2))-methyltransferase RsmD [Alphaproteobacteria bacterium]|nr:16S rRNA (guanine(966)-N(2))-methyltransferase RsmD [Alphaproteobacteria bacterium]
MAMNGNVYVGMKEKNLKGKILVNASKIRKTLLCGKQIFSFFSGVHLISVLFRCVYQDLTLFFFLRKGLNKRSSFKLVNGMRIVGGKYRGKKILAPIHKGTRPTSDRTRETIFNILLHNPVFGPGVLIDKAVLDVFAGTGALGLEALSRGAKSVTFIENDKIALPLLYDNVKAFGLSRTCVFEQDALHLGTTPTSFYDLVFLDPPYHQNLVSPALLHLFSRGWLAKEGSVVIEIAKNETLLLPPFLDLVLERISGAARILFCKKKCDLIS